MFDFGTISPQEAVAWLMSKILMTSEEFEVLDQRAKADAFSITNLANMTEMSYIHKTLIKALEEGKSFSVWKKEIKEIRENNGWTDFRVKTIFNTNMHQAKAIGSWHKMQETKEALPYLKYTSTLGKNARPSHKKMHNIVLPIDHSFWKKFYPPNGFGCQCQAYAISAYKAEKIGITPKNEIVGSADNGWAMNPADGQKNKIDKMLKEKKEELKEEKKKIDKKLK